MWPLVRAHWRKVLPIVAFIVSSLCLLAFGVVHLLERGWFLWWILGSASLGSVVFVLSRFDRSDGLEDSPTSSSQPSTAWTPKEMEAWNEVQALATRVASLPPENWDDTKARATEIISAVSKRLHPGKEFASASFTLPDVLKAVELAVRDLRSEVVRRVPGSDVIQLSQLLNLRKQYEKYESVGLALWYAYRLFRIFQNPLQATLQEVNGAMFDEGKTKSWHVVKGQIARSLLLELGRSAIDLYGGRLKATQAELEQVLIEQSQAAVPLAPVRIAVAGQLKSGKSSLVNALMDEVRAAVSESSTSPGVSEYRLQAPDRPDLVLIDTPGLDGRAGTVEIVLEQIKGADLVIWTVAAANPARDVDADAIKRLLDYYGSETFLRPPALLVAATQVDRLPPRREWAPPYDVARPKSDKAVNIRSALDQVKGDLRLPSAVVVPVSFVHNENPYNVETLWVAIYMMLDDARQTSLRRALENRPGFSIQKAVHQVWGGSRYLGRAFLDEALGRHRKG